MPETRDILKHYFNIGTSETPKYALLGDGIKSLTEEFNPEEDKSQYINQKNGNTDVKSYAPSIAVTKEYIKDEELQNWLDEKVDLLPLGAEAESDYIRINLRRKSTVEGVYKAIKRKCSYRIDNIGGEAGNALATGFTIGGKGDGIQGEFNVKTNTFIPGGVSLAKVEMKSKTEEVKSNG
jgi:hypothetical protein